MEYKIGDRVRHIDFGDGVRHIDFGDGTVTVLTNESCSNIGVCFDEKFDYGHDLDGYCENGHGWWFDTDDTFLTKISAPKSPQNPETPEITIKEMPRGGYVIFKGSELVSACSTLKETLSEVEVIIDG